jgi:hypothetical protein
MHVTQSSIIFILAQFAVSSPRCGMEISADDDEDEARCVCKSFIDLCKHMCMAISARWHEMRDHDSGNQREKVLQKMSVVWHMGMRRVKRARFGIDTDVKIESFQASFRL